MGVTVEYKNELYTLLVDSVGDVIGVEKDRYESNPSTLDPIWREYASGVFRLDGNLMVVLDIGRLLNFASEGDA
ncbi:chemotaxis protein CheW [Varunaivibrio sulfuroxidans]|nr:chemotaxis protein CheW [Varunaivibrio sulfuroxidans]WES32156.1 chemotaxis protein CheW [Varunaivibrio sulfuroxidans]